MVRFHHGVPIDQSKPCTYNRRMDLSRLTSAELVALRDKYRGDKLMDPLIAPAEHQDFTRDTVSNNPWMAAPLAVATPAYYALKQPSLIQLGQKLGLIGQDATPGSIDQLFAAYRGIGQGLFGR